MANRRKPKRHLAWGSLVVNGVADRAACGLSTPRQWSMDPAEVTCALCQRTLSMADAEIAKMFKGRKP